MKNKSKLLVSVLILSVFMLGFVSAGDLRWNWCSWNAQDPDMMTCNTQQYNENSDHDYKWKVVYHKISWFEKKLLHFPWGFP